MAYQQYKRGNNYGLIKFAAVSITKNGCISLNKKCTHEFFEGCNQVELYYDEEDKKIGLKPLDSKTANSYNIIRKDSVQHTTIYGKAFLKHFGLLSGTRTVHAAKWNEEVGLVEVSVEEPVDPATYQPTETNSKKRPPPKKPKPKDLEL